jgi:hypothetical protein
MDGGSIRHLFAWIALGSVGLAGGAIGCGDDEAGDPPCWDTTGTTPAGSVEIGTGEGDFEPLPASLPFFPGTQDGVFLRVRSRMRGLSPGDPSSTRDPANPKTYFSAVLFDGTVVKADCPITAGYRPAEGDVFDLGREFFIEFLPRSLAEMAYDTDVTVILEVIDNERRYARAEAVVFASAPILVDAGVPE